MKSIFHLLHEKEGKITGRMWSKERRKEQSGGITCLVACMEQAGGMKNMKMSRETLQQQAIAHLWLFQMPSG